MRSEAGFPRGRGVLALAVREPSGSGGIEDAEPVVVKFYRRAGGATRRDENIPCAPEPPRRNSRIAPPAANLDALGGGPLPVSPVPVRDIPRRGGNVRRSACGRSPVDRRSRPITRRRTRPFEHRARLSATAMGRDAVEYVLDGGFVASTRIATAGDRRTARLRNAVRSGRPRAAAAAHGDCHRNNVL